VYFYFLLVWNKANEIKTGKAVPPISQLARRVYKRARGVLHAAFGRFVRDRVRCVSSGGYGGRELWFNIYRRVRSMRVVRSRQVQGFGGHITL
jgi:hypothetical protein